MSLSILRPAKGLLMSLCLATTSAMALSLADLSNKDASSGLKAALVAGSSAAVARLGVTDGFLRNEQVKIRLPAMLEQARPYLAMTGYGRQLDELELAMNRAAEAAVPMAKPLLLNAVKSMSVADAKRILSGGETSVTEFFREKTAVQLAEKFRPLVKQVTDRSDLSARYNGVVGRAASFGLVQELPTVEGYVTQRALEGLFTIIAEEEKAIRRDPLGTGSKIIGKVFGALN
ncbi:DUF4197 domain-containing protein [Noviherbaspirillum agri]